MGCQGKSIGLIFTVPKRIFVNGALSLLLTLLSVFYLRYVPTIVGNICGPNGNEFCYEPLPQAGFPFSYWLDRGGISIEGQLGIDDDFSALAFGTDFLVYVLIMFIGNLFIQKWQRFKEKK